MSKIDLICGDSLEVLKQMPKESINLIITSPPYYNLRDYDNELQIGNESCVEDYLQNLMNVFSECFRVLSKDGSFWLNIADVYGKNGLLCIPDKIKIRLIEMGFICRNEIIWHKPNAMPSSAKNRFNNDYEKFYFFTKNKNYYFNTQYEPMKSNQQIKPQKTLNNSKYETIDQESSVRQGMNRNRGNKIIEVRKNLPTQETFVNFLRERTSINCIIENCDISKTKVEHWFRKDKGGFSFPSVEDWEKVKWLIDDYSEDFHNIDFALTSIDYETDDINKNAEKGRIKRAVWHINTKPFKGCHYAPFPVGLVETPIDACSKQGDWVLDPFMGSGTVGVVCKSKGRNFKGIDLNPNYLAIAKTRIENAQG